MSDKKILVTGGAGYIGSHTVLKLLEANKSLIVFDNFSNSNESVIDRIRQIKDGDLKVIKGDITDRSLVKKIFKKYNIDSVIHFAGLKAVSESELFPIKYYKNNVLGSLILFEEMDLAGVKTIVFSSSATVYGEHSFSKYDENTPLRPVNVYGKTKKVIEDILQDIHKTKSDWRIMILRYFNPIGAHSSGKIGDNPTDYPNNLMPFISQVAIGKRSKLLVFGNNYPTPDGTGKRDYIHVEDLAEAHIRALNFLMQNKNIKKILNIGTGNSYSVLEVVKAFEKASKVKIPFQIVSRREGDIAECYADTHKAKNLLAWEPQYDLKSMCRDTWRWQSQNPNGIE